MPSLKDLKVRIGSVKSTQKITKAMKMVAASKLRKAQEHAEAARPYADKMGRMLASLAANTDENAAPALLSGRRDESGKLIDNHRLVVVVSSDRGLCGGFNTNLVKKVKQHVASVTSSGKKVSILTVGKKGHELLRYTHKNSIVKYVDTTQTKQPGYDLADEVAKTIIEMFEKGEIDSIDLMYNEFVNVLTQKPSVKSLVPLDVSSLTKEANDNQVETSASGAIYEYEPSEEAVLDAIVPRNISVQLYGALLENAASVQGARMTAMDNATRNAGDMIKRLTLQYNRSRQAAITKELIEIISGAEAV